LGYTALPINSYGGEWKAELNVGDESGIFTELYQPLTTSSGFYTYGSVFAKKFNLNLSQEDEIIAQLRGNRYQLKLGGGLNFGRWGTFRVGLQRSFNEFHGRIGIPRKITFSSDSTAITSDFVIDTLDTTTFPHYGLDFKLSYENGISLFNGDDKIDTIELSGIKPFTWGKHTLGINYNLNTTFNGLPDELNAVELGGILNLSAYAPGEIKGNHGGVIAAIYYSQVVGSSFLAKTPIYVGATAEVGNLWQERTDANLNSLLWSSSVFIGADTIIGPIYFGVAFGDDGRKNTFLYIGQLF